jgi:hypothetical protein
MNPSAAVVLAALSALLSERPVWAQDSAPTSPPADPPPHAPRAHLPPPPPSWSPPPTYLRPDPEGYIGLHQMLLGEGIALAVPVVLGGVLTKANVDWRITLGSIAAATPLLMGAVVCGVGRAGDAHDGPCLAPIAGATLGSLAAVGLAALVEHSQDPNSDVHIGTAMVAGLGWFVLQPVLAVTAWHLFKRPRATALSLAAVSPAALIPAEPRHGLAHVPGESTLPLLSLRF